MAKVKISDVAREAGVSLGTVSNALNHPEKLRPETLKLINETINRLGYLPNQSARQLAGGTTNAFIAQELGYDVEPGQCTVGISCAGLLCVTEPSSRKSFPNVFYKGQPVDKKIDEALQDYHADTVII